MTLEPGDKLVIIAVVLGLAVMLDALTCCGVPPDDFVLAERVRCMPVDSGSCCTYTASGCAAELCFDAMTTLPPLEVYCRGAR